MFDHIFGSWAKFNITKVSQFQWTNVQRHGCSRRHLNAVRMCLQPNTIPPKITVRAELSKGLEHVPTPATFAASFMAKIGRGSHNSHVETAAMLTLFSHEEFGVSVYPGETNIVLDINTIAYLYLY